MKITDCIRAVALWPLVRPMAPRENWRGWTIRWARFGAFFRIATDGSSWRYDGKRYFLHSSDQFWKVAIGRYNFGIAQQLFDWPNT